MLVDIVRHWIMELEEQLRIIIIIMFIRTYMVSRTRNTNMVIILSIALLLWSYPTGGLGSKSSLHAAPGRIIAVLKKNVYIYIFFFSVYPALNLLSNLCVLWCCPLIHFASRFVQAGANDDVLDRKQYTALHWACYNGGSRGNGENGLVVRNLCDDVIFLCISCLKLVV